MVFVIEKTPGFFTTTRLEIQTDSRFWMWGYRLNRILLLSLLSISSLLNEKKLPFKCLLLRLIASKTSKSLKLLQKVFQKFSKAFSAQRNYNTNNSARFYIFSGEILQFLIFRYHATNFHC